MNKIQPSNFDNAVAEVSALRKECVAKIPELIDVRESKLFHIIAVKVHDRPGEAQNEVVVEVKKLHKIGFEKFNKNFRFLGFSKLIILNDPEKVVIPENQEEGKEEDLIVNASGTQLTPEEIEAEIERRAKAKAQEILEANSGSNQTPGSNVAGSNVGTTATSQEPIDEMTLKELQKFAKDNEIELSGTTKKDEVLTIIKTWLEEQPKK